MLSSPLRMLITLSRCSSLPVFSPSAGTSPSTAGAASDVETTCKNSCVAVSARSKAIW